ncbi:MAG: translation elongation factor Ts [Phycisphaerae bacterium]|nr:translation elongation factor Ts [Phycisphaerae bacterium]
MASISAATVKQLRDQTGQSMMDCKNALVETEGDIELAIELLRKKGMAVMEKRSSKETKEGRIAAKKSDDGKIAVAASICCETDFTSKNDNFGAAVETATNALLAADSAPADVAAFGALATADGRTVSTVISDLVSQSGEKTELGDFARFELTGPGYIHSYVHFNNKVATMIQIDAENDQAANSEAIKTLGADLAMHVTAINPEGLSRDDVDPALIAKEEEIAREQMAGKPANIIENIVKGKIDKWLSQIVLLEQPFVKDDSKTVSELVEEVGKAAGGKLTVKCFTRIQIG